MQRLHIALLAVVVLVLGACFKTESVSTVGADGTAATNIVVEIDLGLFEEIFGGMAEELGGEEQPSIVDEASAELEGFDEDLEALFEAEPSLRERFDASVSLDDKVLRTELRVLTESPEALGLLLDSVLGSGDAELAEILDVEDLELPGQEDLLGSSDGGTGVFSSVEVEMGDEFSFRAEPPASGEFGDDLEVDFGLFDDLTPEIVIEITAPGDIIETNGETSGRTVTWELDGTESEPLTLRSEIDSTATVDGLDAVGSSSSGDDGFPLALVVSILVLAALAVGAFVVIKRQRDDDSPSTGGGDLPDDGTLGPTGP